MMRAMEKAATDIYTFENLRKGGFTTPATCGVRPNGNSAWLWAIVSYYLPAR